MITFKGESVHLKNTLLPVGKKAPQSELVTPSLKRMTLHDLDQNFLLINCAPSFDTSVCAKSYEEFKKQLKDLSSVKLVHVSKDLPFAQARFAKEKGGEIDEFLSAFDSSFASDMGLLMKSGPLKGLLARAVFIFDSTKTLVYQELVSEITHEPNYLAALHALKTHLNIKDQSS